MFNTETSTLSITDPKLDPTRIFDILASYTSGPNDIVNIEIMSDKLRSMPKLDLCSKLKSLKYKGTLATLAFSYEIENIPKSVEHLVLQIWRTNFNVLHRLPDLRYFEFNSCVHDLNYSAPFTPEITPQTRPCLFYLKQVVINNVDPTCEWHYFLQPLQHPIFAFISDRVKDIQQVGTRITITLSAPCLHKDHIFSYPASAKRFIKFFVWILSQRVHKLKYKLKYYIPIELALKTIIPDVLV